MFSQKKIAVVSGILGGLAMTCVGAGHAYAGGSQADCARGSMGSTCIDENEVVYTSKKGDRVVKQHKNCSSNSRQRVVWPQSGLLSPGASKLGPVVNCSNHTPLPKG
ncbi:hypothetical protein [Streptomyces halobius]|uniref:Secreted protein n=1 Tax=Streptomyces halobius TaxID=2879846 RepID=A0ABY4MF40_9ACTN|nr:hypothetical protein [Streptomyces halobius]UQA95035.1 hypothetical protein K9S39_27105 [Streptomyces halobius]